MIKLENIKKKYGDKVVYDGFDRSFGGVTAVLGRSGCGKTTLLNIVAGLTDFEGRAEYEGRLAYMFQQPRLINNLTVLENLTYIGADGEAAKAMLERVEVDGSLYPALLSGGMADRVSLARAFVMRPETLLMDEPFRGLDIGLKTRILKLFKELVSETRPDVLFVTHSPLEACLAADRAVVVEDGRILADFSGDKLTEHALTEVLSAL